MHSISDITGKGCYVIDIAGSPLAIKVDVLRRNPGGGYTAYIDVGLSIPVDHLPALVDLLTAVYGRVKQLNGHEQVKATTDQ